MSDHEKCSYCRQRQPTDTPCVACPSRKAEESVEPRLEAVCGFHSLRRTGDVAVCQSCKAQFSGRALAEIYGGCVDSEGRPYSDTSGQEST